jgi:hypothetical protein
MQLVFRPGGLELLILGLPGYTLFVNQRDFAGLRARRYERGGDYGDCNQRD